MINSQRNNFVIHIQQGHQQQQHQQQPQRLQTPDFSAMKIFNRFRRLFMKFIHYDEAISDCIEFFNKSSSSSSPSFSHDDDQNSDVM
ncbi:hypothetical protein R6Q57_005925, partial [Mikania cordata]